MASRLLDILLSLVAIILSLPILALAAVVIWSGDGHWPFYTGHRVGLGGRDFRMIKLRTMVVGAECLGGSSTPASDRRLLPIGLALRRFKLDELPQFFNVLLGDMSIVGPRPNVRKGGVDSYTGEELRLLSIRPGITDIASIVFSDEGEILKNSTDPDTLYDAVIRPWKNRLALQYVDQQSFTVDLRIVALTLVNLVSRQAALRGADKILGEWGVETTLRGICTRTKPLPAGLPPGNVA